MKQLCLALCLFVLAGCSSYKTQLKLMSNEAYLLEAPTDWDKNIWNIEVLHDLKEFRYSFTARFKNEPINFNVCLQRHRDDPWLEVEILELRDQDKTLTDLVAAYHIEGASLRIMMVSNLCDHAYEVLNTKITSNEIKGYQTHLVWDKTTVTGTVNGVRITSLQ